MASRNLSFAAVLALTACLCFFAGDLALSAPQSPPANTPQEATEKRGLRINNEKQATAVDSTKAQGAGTSSPHARPEVVVPQGFLSPKEITFSPDGRLLASGSGEGQIVLYDFASRREIARFAIKGSRVSSPAFSADSQTLAGRFQIGSDPDDSLGDSGIVFWDVATGRVRQTLAAHNDFFSLSSDGKTLACVTNNQQFDSNNKPEHSSVIALWDAATGKQLRSLAAQVEAVQAIAFSPDGQLLASIGGKDGYSDDDQPQGYPVEMWRVASGERLRALIGHAFENADKKLDQLLASGEKNSATAEEKKANLDSAALTIGLFALKFKDKGLKPSAIAFSADGKKLICVGEYGGKTDASGGIKIWSVDSGEDVTPLLMELGLAKAETVFELESVAISPDSKTLVTGAKEADAILFWNAEAGTLTRVTAGYTDNLPEIYKNDPLFFKSGAGKYSSPVGRLTFNPDGKILASGDMSTGTELWDAATGEKLASVIASGEDDWLVVTLDGFFDGSPRAYEQIVWRFSNALFDIAPVEVFFNDYYPGLLADICAGKRPHAPQSISDKDRRQPAVNVALADSTASPNKVISSRSVQLKIQLAAAPADPTHATGSGARDVRLFRNGALVKQWHGDVLNGQATATLAATVSLVAGDNVFTAYAFNHDNVKSADATLTLYGSERLKQAGTVYLLAIGVNQYANAGFNLRYAAPDAQAFAAEFQKQQMKLGTFGKVEVIALLDSAATKANVLRALARLAGKDTAPLAADDALARLRTAQPEDAVVIYFAGHGLAVQPRFYLIPHDLGYSGRRNEVDEASLNNLLAHSISDREMEQAFEAIDASQLLLVIDACNSGQALEAEEKRRGPMNSRGLAQLAYEKGMVILTAAQGYQAALEAAELGHGYLTYALVEEGLKTAAADQSPKDNQVTLREWLDYAMRRVPQMQLQTLRESRGLKIAFVQGEEKMADPAKRSLQRPRVFYRRTADAQPVIVAKP